MLLKETARLRNQYKMCPDVSDIFKLSSLGGHQIDPHPHKLFVDDVQSAFRKQPVDIGDPPVC